MDQQNRPETSDVTIQRLQAELAAERSRADHAEAELLQVKEAVRAFRLKQEQVARARKAREAAQNASVAASVAAVAPVSEPAGAQPQQPTPQEQPVPESAASTQASTSDTTVPEKTVSSPTGTALADALEHPDTDLDARLDRFLEHSLEPDASREWMLED